MNIIGTIYFLSFIFIISISGVYQAHISQTLSPIVFLFFSSLFCFIVFSLTCYFKNGGQFIKKALAHKKNIFWINFANFSVWFCYMFAIKYLEPAVAVIIGNASGPILVIIISKILRPHYKIFRIEKIASI
ncbi:MAG: EamA family transporter, partial [Bdellovibrionota bacterium]